MKTERKKLLTISVVSISLWLSVSIEILSAQTGGGYDLSHNVIASGGSNSTGGSFTFDGTAGQAIAGVQSTGAPFSLRGGFWTPQSFAPTAAGTSISGRVQTADEYGITKAQLTLTNVSTGEVRTAISSSFGYYRFDDVPVGAFYQLQVSTKRYVFGEDTRYINLIDEVVDLNFVGTPVP